MDRARYDDHEMRDCWRVYNILDKEGFQHLTVNHSYNVVDPGANTQSVERMGEISATILRNMASRRGTLLGLSFGVYFMYLLSVYLCKLEFSYKCISCFLEIILF